jgi:uncharacterized membrane protein (UPF0127 family)
MSKRWFRIIQNLGTGFCFLFLAGAGPARLESKKETLFQDFQFCGKPYHLEIAKSLENRTEGLMYREAVPESGGMLFIFREPQVLSFWMKNVKIPLDIAFLNSQGKVVRVHRMTPESLMMNDEKRALYSSDKPAQFAVEFAANTITRMPHAEIMRCELRPLPKIDETVE